MTELSKDEALQLVREHSREERTGEVACGHRGCEEHPSPGQRKMIHTFLTFEFDTVAAFGADVALEDAENEIRGAHEVRWSESVLHHDLAIRTAAGRVLRFDVRRPAADSGTTLTSVLSPERTDT